MKKIGLLLWLFSPLAACGQTILTGTVKDSTSGLPVAGATLTTIPGHVAAITNGHGRFNLRIKGVSDSMSIYSLGYTPKVIALPDNSLPMVILIRHASSFLATFEVLGSGLATAATTLNRSELERSSGLSLQDALNTVPGVDMQSRSPWGGQRIIIRGYYPSVDNGRSDAENFGGLGYQLSIDNVPVTDATGTTVMDDIDFSTLGSVELIRGPSALYGSYTAGAVNLFTPVPRPGRSSFRETATAGSNGLFRTNTSFRSSNGNSDLWVNYGHQTYQGFRPHDASRKDYISVAGHLHLGHRESVSYYYSFNHSFEDLAGEIDSADFYHRKAISDSNYLANDAHVDIVSFRTGITNQYQFNIHFSSQTTLFATGSSLDQHFAHGFNNNENLNFGGRAAFNYQGKTGPVAINGTIGAFFQQSSQNSQGNFILPLIQPPFSPSSPYDIPSDLHNTASNSYLFTQWWAGLPAQISLTLDGSLSFNTFSTRNLLASNVLYLNNPVFTRKFSPVFAPGLTLLKAWGSLMTTSVSINLGYAPPTISQMTTTAGQVDTRLNPESAVQYEISAKSTQNKNRKFFWQLSLFDLNITNRLVQETANSISYFTNAGREENRGMELEAGYDALRAGQGAIKRVHPWISYAYSDFTYLDFMDYGKSSAGQDSLLVNYSGNRVAAVPPNVLNLGLDIDTRPGIYFSGTDRYVDKTPLDFNNANYMKPYDLLSAKIGYRKDLGRHFSMDIYLGADNLLNSTWYSFLFVGQNIQELAQGNDPNISHGGGDGYILPAPYRATAYGGASIKYIP
ncbi:MAG TPA: TonB-dependent receptor plug domain-containing protein [Chitinophagaceae bacterium]|nr:TonB-dependent receptor plug domain-containing protein [Chitinophagaceae bacterium]